jgi:hypothetical protein
MPSGRPRRSNHRGVGGARVRGLPSVSRLTIRPTTRVPLARSGRLGEALRASREALSDIERQLEALLRAVRAPSGRPDADAPDRLGHAARRADAALGRLADA